MDNCYDNFYFISNEDDLHYDKKDIKILFHFLFIILKCETLLDIVNGILDISKIEANKLEIIDKEYYSSRMSPEEYSRKITQVLRNMKVIVDS